MWVFVDAPANVTPAARRRSGSAVQVLGLWIATPAEEQATIRLLPNRWRIPGPPAKVPGR
jgi:hypothetical protein